MSYCGEWTAVKAAPGKLHLATLRCRAWTCPTCQPNRRRRLIAEAIRGRPDTFITLTLRADTNQQPADAVKTLSRAWRLIRKRHTRLHPLEKLPFLAVVERTRQGTPHLHILLRSRWIDQRWLSDAMREITGSFVTDIRRVGNARRPAAYIAKYIGKDPAKIGSTKRYWQSRDYQIDPRAALPPLPPGTRYERPLRRPLRTVVANFRQLGYEIAWQDDGTAVVDLVAHTPRPHPWDRL